MESRVLKALQKIKKETQRRHKALRESCDSIIGKDGPKNDKWHLKMGKMTPRFPIRYVAEQLQSKDLREEDIEGDGQEGDADKYFEPFKVGF